MKRTRNGKRKRKRREPCKAEAYTDNKSESQRIEEKAIAEKRTNKRAEQK